MQESNYQFYGLGIAPRLTDTLSQLKFKTATPIQHQAIPVALEGKDLIGIAQTGTGKTLAFGIPTLQRLTHDNKGKALILVPTRELAFQVEESLLKFAHSVGLKTVTLVGGDSIHKQIMALSRMPRVLIATPGRLIDLMEQRKVHLRDVRILVLDEADRMLDMGFAPQIDRILQSVPSERQTLLFSATMPGLIVKMASKYMKSPVQVEVAPPGTAASGVTHELFIVKHDRKKELLGKLLAQYKGSVLLFCRTKIGASKIVRAIRQMNHSAAEIHSDRSLGQRREALAGFKAGKYHVLVATDIAARGVDVVGIELVINYDLPDEAENYIHRIGRTGRAGCVGHAISFASPDERKDIINIERLMQTSLPISHHHPDITSENFEKPQRVFSFNRFSRHGRRSPSRGNRR